MYDIGCWKQTAISLLLSIKSFRSKKCELIIGVFSHVKIHDSLTFPEKTEKRLKFVSKDLAMRTVYRLMIALVK